jgi:hypothetical protein
MLYINKCSCPPAKKLASQSVGRAISENNERNSGGGMRMIARNKADTEGAIFNAV